MCPAAYGQIKTIKPNGCGELAQTGLGALAGGPEPAAAPAVLVLVTVVPGGAVSGLGGYSIGRAEGDELLAQVAQVGS